MRLPDSLPVSGDLPALHPHRLHAFFAQQFFEACADSKFGKAGDILSFVHFQEAVWIAFKGFEIPGKGLTEFRIQAWPRTVIAQIPDLERNTAVLSERLPERDLILNRMRCEYCEQ